ncbi:MAG: RidA family protein [Planctomycetota bacterium]
MTHEQRLVALDLQLPPAPKSIGLYRGLLVTGGMAYTSGHGPLLPGGTLITGCVGADLDTAAGHAAARQTGLAMIATLRKELGTLDRVRRLVKTFGLVRAAPDFTDHPAVINGFSELMRDVFGDEAGVSARSAVGAASLPAGMAVEVEAVFELCPQDKS